MTWRDSCFADPGGGYLLLSCDIRVGGMRDRMMFRGAV